VSDKEWTLFMTGETYLKVAQAAEVLGFASVEEMFFDYDICTTGLVPEGKVIMGKNVVLGELLEERPVTTQPTSRPPLTSYPLTVYPMTTTQQWTITNSANSDETALRSAAFHAIASVGS
jgi:hypothetical protein